MVASHYNATNTCFMDLMGTCLNEACKYKLTDPREKDETLTSLS